MKQPPLTLRRWRRVEFERLVELGAFDEGDPVELIGGQLIVAEPKGSEHATAVGMANDALRTALPSGWIVRVQDPVALDDESAPEPDLAVVHGSRADYRYAHPARPALIIEVAESSLRWIVNLIDRVVEVSRGPGPDLTAPYGWRYLSVERFGAPRTITPIGVPAAPIPVASLIP